MIISLSVPIAVSAVCRLPTSNFISAYCFSVTHSKRTFPSCGIPFLILFSSLFAYSLLGHILTYMEYWIITKPSCIRFFLNILYALLCSSVSTGKSNIHSILMILYFSILLCPFHYQRCILFHIVFNHITYVHLFISVHDLHI